MRSLLMVIAGFGFMNVASAETKNVIFHCSAFATELEGGESKPDLGQVVFEIEDKVREEADWLNDLQIHVMESDVVKEKQAVTLYSVPLTPNRGAIGRVGTWKFWKWGVSVRIFTNDFQKDDPSKKVEYPHYRVELVDVHEAAYVIYEKSEEDSFVAVCKPNN